MSPLETWNWFSFVVGAVAGVGLTWVLVLVEQARHAEETDHRFRP